MDIDLGAALKKHSDFKAILRDAIMNKNTLDVDIIKKVDCCEFGKWLLDENTHSQLNHLASYHNCVEQHAKLHEAAANIAVVINAKQYDEADQMFNDTASNFSKASHGIGSAVMHLMQETRRALRMGA
jgi:methyl-accepting chemotaxis protein